jgi:hypothetical protein
VKTEQYATFSYIRIYYAGHAVAQLVETLRYKPEGHGFIPDVVIGIFY